MSRKVLATMDYAGHIRVFDLTDEAKAREKLKKVFKDLTGELEDEEFLEAVEDLDWDRIGHILQECGFPCHGRELIVDLEEMIEVKNLE